MGVPEKMKAKGRDPDPHFHPDETLFRRVPLEKWGPQSPEFDMFAMELPDVSVVRSRYGHAEWARFDTVSGAANEDWGVLGIHVRDVPSELFEAGVFKYTLQVTHDPLDFNYPHSEIRIFENGLHLTGDLAIRISEPLRMRIRYKMLLKLRAIIKPGQCVVVRTEPPKSHKLEPHETC